MRKRESIEISATTVESAVELALEQLGRSREEVEVTVLRRPNEPDEHGYATDEALVLVETRSDAAEAPQLQRPRHELSPSERMRASQVGQEVLSDLLHHMSLIASCHVGPSSGNSQGEMPVVLEVEGEDLGVLIGRRGENLNSLQQIVNLIVQKRLGLWPNIQVDVAGYRHKREQSLESLARRTARRVADTQQPYTFEPMPARERRIIHLAVQQDSRVYTESTGEGDERRVVMYPA